MTTQKSSFCAAWHAKTLFSSGTELEAAEWIKFLVLETRFSSNSSRTHHLILCSSSAIFVPRVSISQYALWLEFLGPNFPRPSPNCWMCFVVEVDVRSFGCEVNRRWRKEEFLLMLIFFSCWIRHISNVDYYINRWSWTDFIVDVEKNCWVQIGCWCW